MLHIHSEHYELSEAANNIYQAQDMTQAKNTLYYSIGKFLNEKQSAHNFPPNSIRMILEAMNPTNSPTPLRLMHETITRNVYARAANIQNGILIADYWVTKESPYEYMISLPGYGHHHVSFYITKEASQ